MTPTRVSIALAFAVLLPFGFALAFALLSYAPRARRPLAVIYGVVMLALNGLLLEGYMVNSKLVGWGSLKMSRYGFPVFLVLTFMSAAIVLYKGAGRGEDKRSPGLLLASIVAATGFGALAALSSAIAGFALCWEGATAAALVGLAAHGSSGFRGRLISFIPWLAADGLFIVGVILVRSLLKEGGLLITQPLIHGSETQVELIMLLFLASAALRLGIFPLNVRRRDLVRRCDGSWNAFFLCTLNVLLTGYFLLVTSALIARLSTADWSLLIALAGLLSVVAGPLLAARSRGYSGYLSGILTMTGGLLFLCAGLYSRAGLESFLLLLLTTPLALSAMTLAAGRLSMPRLSSPVETHRVVAPALMAGLLLAGVSLSALPPSDGFVSRAAAVLACLDKALANPWYSLMAALVLAAFALAAYATFTAVPGLLKGGTGAGTSREKAFTAVIPLLALLAFFTGVVPGPLVRNLVQPASRALFVTGFTGPGVVFHAVADPVSKALAVYPRWSEAAAAFVLACALAALLPYLSKGKPAPLT